ncbi:MAG: hypothetical protein IKC11_02665 [Clostridia bacterium]|nr:hypothetical protein [Clostridia bacterium]
MYNIEDRKELAFINLQDEGMKDKILELEKRFFKKEYTSNIAWMQEVVALCFKVIKI